MEEKRQNLLKMGNKLFMVSEYLRYFPEADCNPGLRGAAIILLEIKNDVDKMEKGLMSSA